VLEVSSIQSKEPLLMDQVRFKDSMLEFYTRRFQLLPAERFGSGVAFCERHVNYVFLIFSNK